MGPSHRAIAAARSVVSMRWWLAVTFAAVAALTAAFAVRAVSHRTESAFRRNAETLALGNAVATAEAIKHSPSGLDLRLTAATASATRAMTLFVFDRRGRTIATGAV